MADSEGQVEGPPLEGIRVLDLTQGIAGPYATKLYADYGADVIKIERPDGGDPLRRVGPFPGDEPHPERGGVFLHINTGKRSVTLNLKTASGQGILQRLAERSDLVFENFRPGTLERLGLDAGRLAELRPAASLIRISNFGQYGPYRDFEADDMLLYATGGVLQVTGVPEREPVKIGLYAPLFLAGAVATAMSFGALMAADRDGVGQTVDVSMQDVLTASMDRGGPNLVAWQYSGSMMHMRMRELRRNAIPRGVYPCQDGYVFVNGTLQWFDRFCRMIGRPDLIDDEETLAQLEHIEYGERFDGLLFPWLLERTKQQVMEEAQQEGLPVGAINSMADVFADPHLRAREFITTIEHPEAGAFEFPGLPFRMHGTPGRLRRAPLLGEHTSEVLTTELGYTPAEVVILRQRNVV